MLKFALPSTPDSGVPQLPAGKSDWTIPHLIVKAGDVDKLDVLLAPMADSKLSKRPEDKKTGGDDVGEAENNETDDKKRARENQEGGQRTRKGRVELELEKMTVLKALWQRSSIPRAIPVNLSLETICSMPSTTRWRGCLLGSVVLRARALL